MKENLFKNCKDCYYYHHTNCTEDNDLIKEDLSQQECNGYEPNEYVKMKIDEAYQEGYSKALNEYGHEYSEKVDELRKIKEQVISLIKKGHIADDTYKIDIDKIAEQFSS